MQYTTDYTSPLGDILLACDDKGLTGLWFVGSKYFARGLQSDHERRAHSVFAETKKWLDIYFSGQEPDFQPPLHLRGSPFQLEVWEQLCNIPYGKITTYGILTRRIAAIRGREQMSARAVGGAVGRNPVSLIVPCHRVVGADGNLTGYAGGAEKKCGLLLLEGIDVTELSVLAGELRGVVKGKRNA